ncbi:hypothetical protein EK21DRAFT_84587 [Setomelanomma holmii]|uniref:Uncharacterized protein n=1 Tax=Setomelanomma holmii TaxID=210430 RepID=A0A9P4HL56_9PLEO|nr:hypothetical protein EK21DRAFT_84587 [Setomelanomma holmii]
MAPFHNSDIDPLEAVQHDIDILVNTSLHTCTFEGTEIEFLAPSAINAIATEHNIREYVTNSPYTVDLDPPLQEAFITTILKDGKAMFTNIVAGGEVYPMGRMQFLFRMLWPASGQKLTDENLPFNQSYTKIPGDVDFSQELQAFCKTQPLRAPDRSYLPLVYALRKDTLMVHPKVEATYEVKFHREYCDGLDDESFSMLEFSAEAWTKLDQEGEAQDLREAGVMGFWCEGKYYLVNQMPAANGESTVT